MKLSKRIIARLDVKGNRLIKGIRFEGLRVVGDPFNAAVKYFNQGADEILYIDSVASLYGRNSLADVLEKTSKEVFVPVTAGGGIRNIDDAKKLLASGADKIAVNTEFIKRPSFISELANQFGKQCVVVSIQARRRNEDEWECMTEAGREKSEKKVFDWISEAQQLGAGEILLTSVDQDGTCKGPDIDLIEKMEKICKIPLIIGGGFATKEQFANAFDKDFISGVSISAALHKGNITIENLKTQLGNQNFYIRNKSAFKFENQNSDLKGLNIGVIDYGMGNQRSLINALSHLKANVILSSNKKELDKCDLLTLPGVGAFPKGMSNLRNIKLDEYIRNRVQKGVPLLGICLGMQMLFSKGFEFKEIEGLGLIQGEVVSMETFNKSDKKLRLPHMGWNNLISKNNHAFSQRYNNKSQYFVHSFIADKVADNEKLFISSYENIDFIAAVKKGCVLGFQFHPERGGEVGLNLLLESILELCRNKISY
jgi:imidazole glycerol phosphate synthase glutamine amidotransferase subunit